MLWVALVILFLFCVFCLVFYAAFVFAMKRKMKSLHEEITHPDNVPPSYFDEEALAMVKKKQSETHEMAAMGLKFLFVKSWHGVTRWEDYKTILTVVDQELPKNLDCIVGVTSGGWLTGLMLAHIRGIPCYQLKYSRYHNSKTNNKKSRVKSILFGAVDDDEQTKKKKKKQQQNMLEKMSVFFKGKKVAFKTSPDWTSTEHRLKLNVDPKMLQNKTVLLVDDTIGSGASIRVCKAYIETLFPRKLYTYVYAATKPDLVDYYTTTKHSDAFAWGLDI